MHIYTADEKYPAGRPGTAIALGYFDGMHIGHRAVLDAAAAHAAAHGLDLAAFTFTLPPGQGLKGLRLQTPAQKYALLAAWGVQYCYAPAFESICSLPPEAFFTDLLLSQYGAKAVFCGADFRFGAHKAGDAALLQSLCGGQGLHFGIVPMARYQGEEVSSTRIRTALAVGDISLVNALLGRPYQICLPVQRGKGLGRTLGMPTLNQIYPPDMQPPARGVYITQALVNGQVLPSVTGYGNRPTVDGQGADSCETFIPGFAGELYEQEINVSFYKKLAEVRAFASTEELGAAVRAWAKEAQAFFA